MKVADKEDLRDLIDHSGFESLLLELENLVKAAESTVLRLDLSSPNSAQTLLIEKARAEGARRLAEVFKRRMESFRPKK